MKATELRIGNLLQVNGKIYSVAKLTKSGCRLQPLDDSEVEAGNIEPIPLTEDLLLKLGFEECFTGFFEKADFLFDIQYDGYPRKYELIFDANDGLCYHKKEIKYVHQLQNLYYALTGEELKTND